MQKIKNTKHGITIDVQHQFKLCMHAHKVWSALLATKQQATDISWFLYSHTHLSTEKHTVRGIKQPAEEKTPNATKHDPADLRKSGLDHGPTSGSWPQQPAEGDSAVHDCNKLLIITDQLSVNWNNLFLALRPSSYDAHGKARLICH